MKKNNLLLCLFLFFSLSLFSQKIKLKKDIITIDKKEMYKIEKTKKGGLMGASNFQFKTIDGKILLELKNTPLQYDSLPHEERRRTALKCYEVTAPELGQSILIKHLRGLNTKKILFEQLVDMNFFATGTLDQTFFNSFCEKNGQSEVKKVLEGMDSINVMRKENYKLTLEAFGELQQRPASSVRLEGTSIIEGLTTIGRIKRKKTGSYATVYDVENSDGTKIASMTLIAKEKRANVRPMVNDKLKWFNQKGEWNVTLIQEEILNYLVIYGFL